MDTGEGRFEKLESLEAEHQLRGKYPKSKGVFQIGEVIEVKGSRLKVERINKDRIIFKLLRAE